MALHLGMTRSQMIHFMTQSELVEASYFFQLEPFGYRNSALEFANLKAVIYNAMGSGKRVFTGEDFLPKDFFGTPEKTQKVLTPSALRSLLGHPKKNGNTKGGLVSKAHNDLLNDHQRAQYQK